MTTTEIKLSPVARYQLEVAEARRCIRELEATNRDLLRIAAIYYRRYGAVNVTAAEYAAARGSEVTTREEQDGEGRVLYRVEVI